MLPTRFRVLLAVLALPALLGFAPPHPRAAAPAPGSKKVVIGQPAPEFTLRTFGKEDISLSSLRGQVVVLNLWATWCVPCREEMPMMDRYFRTHSAKGLRIFAVATEDSVRPGRLKELSNALAFPLAGRLRGGAYDPLKGVPTSYIIDRKGVVRYAKAAAFTWESFDAVLRPLLAEPAPPPLTASR
ncbi:MAG: TlpA disulfide reductase family protein [Pseudomonadota bacterium]